MTGHIFISYARKDGREYASRLDSDLQKIGFHTWRDTRDIDPAQDFSAEIENGIEKAACVALCVTPDSKRSDSFVRREIQYAQIVKKPVIPLRFADIPPHVPVINNEWIDFFKGWEPAFERLCTILKQPIAEPLPTAAPLDDPFRDYLNALYQNIVHYLNLTVFSLITLRGESTPDAIAGTETAQVLPMAFWEMALLPDQKPKHFRDFPEAFEEYQGRVLLLGDPGAGKTTTLFAFARDAVARRLENPALPLPILAPIATWDAAKQSPLVDWLTASIPMLKQSDLSHLIDSGKALLLLDGLDELGGERSSETSEDAEPSRYDPRLRFLNLVPSQTPVIVTCRVKDYAEIGEKLALNGAVTLQPLNDAQMKAYLGDMPDLWAALESDPELREVARTPLLLSLFTFAFRDLPDEAKALRDLTRGDLRDKIFETYVRRRYEREARKPNAKMPFTLDECYRVLGQVAMWNAENPFVGENIITQSAFLNALESSRVLVFIEFVTRLNLLIHLEGYESPAYKYIHLLLLDHFAYRYAVRCLDSDDNKIRYSAVQALGKLADSRAVEKLIAILQKDRWYIRATAAETLGKVGDLQAVEPLIAALTDLEPKVRQNAADALAKLRDNRAVENLITALQDTSAHVRRSAIYALAAMGDRAAIEPIIRLLREDDRMTRRSAAEALGKFKDESAGNVLITALYDDDVYVRMSAAQSLGELMSIKAVKHLQEALQDTDVYVQSAARRALEKIATPGATAAVAAWRKQHGDM